MIKVDICSSAFINLKSSIALMNDIFYKITCIHLVKCKPCIIRIIMYDFIMEFENN